MKNERVYRMTFASLYPLYIQKAERKGRTREEVDAFLKANLADKNRQENTNDRAGK